MILHTGSEMRVHPTFRFHRGTERIEKPPMAVRFLLAVFLKAKEDTNRKVKIPGRLFIGSAGCMLEDVRDDILVILGFVSSIFFVTANLHGLLGANTKVWIWTYFIEEFEDPLIDLAPTIRNNANDDFLPAIFSPCLGSFDIAEVSDILDHPAIWRQY
jgi:hypothetical protein